MYLITLSSSDFNHELILESYFKIIRMSFYLMNFERVHIIIYRLKFYYSMYAGVWVQLFPNNRNYTSIILFI